MKPKPPTEEQECILLADYLDLLVTTGKVVVYTHTAQETFTRSWRIKAKNKRVGVRRGIPDYVIVTPKHVLFIEMKRTKGGVISKPQKQWIEAIKNTGGIAEVCKGFQEAKEFIESYL